MAWSTAWAFASSQSDGDDFRDQAEAGVDQPIGLIIATRVDAQLLAYGGGGIADLIDRLLQLYIGNFQRPLPVFHFARLIHTDLATVWLLTLRQAVHVLLLKEGHWRDTVRNPPGAELAANRWDHLVEPRRKPSVGPAMACSKFEGARSCLGGNGDRQDRAGQRIDWRP